MEVSRAATDVATKQLFKNRNVSLQKRWADQLDEASNLVWWVASEIAHEFEAGEPANGDAWHQSDVEAFRSARKIEATATKASDAIADLLAALSSTEVSTSNSASNRRRCLSILLGYVGDENDPARDADPASFEVLAGMIEAQLQGAILCANSLHEFARKRKEDLRSSQQQVGALGDQLVVDVWLRVYVDFTGAKPAKVNVDGVSPFGTFLKCVSARDISASAINTAIKNMRDDAVSLIARQGVRKWWEELRDLPACDEKTAVSDP
jgi:hypothetical protein